MSHLSFSLLGSFQLQKNGQLVTAFHSAKVRALLAYLAVEAARPHQRTALAGLFWPEWPEAAARTYLRQAVNNLQTLLDDQAATNPILQITRHTLQYQRVNHLWLDVDHFCAQGELGGTIRPHTLNLQSIEKLQQAVALYQAPFMSGFVLDGCAEFEQWVTLTRSRLQRLMLTMLQTLADHYERLGSYEQSHQYAWRAIEVEPTQEAAHQQVMRLLAYLGQRSSALLQFERCRTLLRQELAVEPSVATVALYEQIRDNFLPRPSAPTPVAAKTPPSLQPIPAKRLANLPNQTTPFVGRQQELRDLQARLANPDCRLVTLLGPGGIGKTRLAIAVAHAMAAAFTQGVCYVSLVGANDPAALPGLLAEALQFTFSDVADPSQYLFDYLHEKAMLLVFDNYEQLLPDVAFLQALLAAAPGVKLLVTSRERLHLSQEWLLPLSGLAFPDEQTMSRQQESATSIQISQFDALTLFVKCAQRVRAEFAFSHDPAAIIQICQLVGGMPLAIELATGWLRILSCRQIAEKLTANLDLLTTKLQDVAARHQSMKAVFVQSWKFLTENEQRILRRLAVFRSSFLYDAAVVIAEAELSVLLGLVDKSLLQADAHGRFQLHELLRQFALEQLKISSTEYFMVHNAYGDYYLRLLHSNINLGLQSISKTQVNCVTIEFANLVACWNWVLAQEEYKSIGEVVFELWLYGSFIGYHKIYSMIESAAGLLRKLIKQTDVIHDSEQLTRLSAVQIRILIAHGIMGYRLGHRQQAEEVTEEAWGLLNNLPDTAAYERAWLYILTGWRIHFRENLSEATSAGFRALELFGNRSGWVERCNAYLLLGWTTYQAGDYAQAQRFSTILQVEFSTFIDANVWVLPLLAAIAHARGDYEQANTLTQQCYEMQRAANDIVGSTHTLCRLAHTYRKQGQLEQAALYYQASLENAKEYGLHVVIETCQYGLGWIYYKQGDYIQAQQCFESKLQLAKAQNSQTSNVGVTATLNGLAAVATAQAQYAEATHYLHQALTIAQQSATLPLLLDILLQWAILAQRQGQVRQAVDLLQAVHQHPATKHATRENADQLLAEIAALSGETLAVANQQGKAIDLEALVAALLSAALQPD